MFYSHGHTQKYWHERWHWNHRNNVFQTSNSMGIIDKWNRAEKLAWVMTLQLANDVCETFNSMGILDKHDWTIIETLLSWLISQNSLFSKKNIEHTNSIRTFECLLSFNYFDFIPYYQCILHNPDGMLLCWVTTQLHFTYDDDNLWGVVGG